MVVLTLLDRGAIEIEPHVVVTALPPKRSRFGALNRFAFLGKKMARRKTPEQKTEIREKGGKPLTREAPAHFTDIEAQLWQHAIDHAPQGLLFESDRHCLEAWVKSTALADACYAQLALEGATVRCANGSVAKHPAASVLAQASATARAEGARLGFSPTDRVRLGLTHKTPEELSELATWDEFKHG